MKIKGYIIGIILKKTSRGEENVHYDLAVKNSRNNGLWCGCGKTTFFASKEEAEEAILKSEKYGQRPDFDWSNYSYKIWKLV